MSKDTSEHQPEISELASEFICIEERSSPESQYYDQSPIRKFHSDSIFTPTPIRASGIVHPSMIPQLAVKKHIAYEHDKVQPPLTQHNQKEKKEKDPVLKDPSVEEIKLVLKDRRPPQAKSCPHWHKLMFMGAFLVGAMSVILGLFLTSGNSDHFLNPKRLVIWDASENDHDKSMIGKNGTLIQSATSWTEGASIWLKKPLNIDGLTWGNAIELLRKDSDNMGLSFRLAYLDAEYGCQCQYDLRSDMSLSRVCRCTQSLSNCAIKSSLPKLEPEPFDFQLILKEPSWYDEFMKKIEYQSRWLWHQARQFGRRFALHSKFAALTMKRTIKTFYSGSKPPIKRFFLAAHDTSSSAYNSTCGMYDRGKEKFASLAEVLAKYCERS